MYSGCQRVVTFINVPRQLPPSNISDIQLQSLWIGAELIAFIVYALALSPRPIYLSLQVGASVLIYALVINDAKRIRTYIYLTLNEAFTFTWMRFTNTNTIHTPRQSLSQSVKPLSVIHSAGLHFYSHKCETTKETINRVLLSWTKKKKKKLVSTQTLPHSLYAFAWCCCLCFLEHSVEREGWEGVATRNIRNIIWIWLSEGGKGRASWAK